MVKHIHLSHLLAMDMTLLVGITEVTFSQVELGISKQMLAYKLIGHQFIALFTLMLMVVIH